MGSRSRGKRNPDIPAFLLQESDIPDFVIHARKSTDKSSEKQTNYVQKREIKLKPELADMFVFSGGPGRD
jgi:hypothetical protein